MMPRCSPNQQHFTTGLSRPSLPATARSACWSSRSISSIANARGREPAARPSKDLGYGFLGQYRRHVKDHINRLLDLGHHTCIANPLEALLITTALLYGRHHKGMQRWPVIVERIGILLADPNHPEWGQDGQGVRALAQMPQETPSPEGLTAALLSAPSSLPVTVLEWLSHHLLYCAAPPYSLRWDEQSRRTRLHDV